MCSIFSVQTDYCSDVMLIKDTGFAQSNYVALLQLPQIIENMAVGIHLKKKVNSRVTMPLLYCALTQLTRQMSIYLFGFINFFFTLFTYLVIRLIEV